MENQFVLQPSQHAKIVQRDNQNSILCGAKFPDFVLPTFVTGKSKRNVKKFMIYDLWACIYFRAFLNSLCFQKSTFVVIKVFKRCNKTFNL